MKQTIFVLFGVLAVIHAAASVCSNCGSGCGCGYNSVGLGSGCGGVSGLRSGGYGGGVVGGVRGAGFGGSFGRFGGIVGAGGFGGVGAGAGGAVVQPVVGPGRIIVQEAPAVIPDYVESEPTVILQEAAPRFVFGDANPIRLNHVSRPAVIEHFETPYIIDAVQRSAFINHAAQPVIIDHYEEPEVIRDEGLPVIYEACDCGAAGCNGGCGPAIPFPVAQADCGCHQSKI